MINGVLPAEGQKKSRYDPASFLQPNLHSLMVDKVSLSMYSMPTVKAR